MEQQALQNLAQQLNVSEEFATLLSLRGIDNAEDAMKYLHPSVDDMCSPLEINGMKEAVERVKIAIEKKERVLVFGDYDCDGISAISILVLYLRDKLSVDYFIPNRNVDGYGLTTAAIDGILSKKRPDLVITVDCGITSHREVAYLKEKGIDIIVTDHHEPQEVLPECIVVDPKVEKKGFYNFCGAGVALKLVEALSSRKEIEKYFDIAALATVADVVPLEGDNRIIAYYGLKTMTTKPRLGLKLLLGKDKVNSYGIMFRIAPRINAAGRLDSAMKVVELFLSDNPTLLSLLVKDLENDNTRRQEICETVVAEAKAMLHDIDYDKTRMIVLASDNWEAGVLGIAAARLVEEFKCPAVLFSKKDDGLLRGSARSIKSVNIFELFSKFSGYFEAFGGHSQAAGVTIKEENLDAFKNAVNEELLQTHDDDEFKTQYHSDMTLDISKPLLQFAKELEMLEPTGYGNPKPVFDIACDGLRFDRLAFTSHIKYTGKNCELIGFYCLDNIGATKGGMNLEVTLTRNVYQNNEYAQGVIKSIRTTRVDLSKEDAMVLNVHQLAASERAEAPLMERDVLKKFLKKSFGTLLVCFDGEQYEELCENYEEIKKLPVHIGTTPFFNPENCVLIAPSAAFDFGYYKRVVIAGAPLSDKYLGEVSRTARELFMLKRYAALNPKISEDLLVATFREFRSMAFKNERAGSPARLLGEVRQHVKISDFEFATIWQILCELNVISINDWGRIETSNVKTDRTKSATYRNTR